MMRAVVRMIVGLVLTVAAPLAAQGPGTIRGSVADSQRLPPFQCLDHSRWYRTQNHLRQPG